MKKEKIDYAVLDEYGCIEKPFKHYELYQRIEPAKWAYSGFTIALFPMLIFCGLYIFFDLKLIALLYLSACILLLIWGIEIAYMLIDPNVDDKTYSLEDVRFYNEMHIDVIYMENKISKEKYLELKDKYLKS